MPTFKNCHSLFTISKWKIYVHCVIVRACEWRIQVISCPEGQYLDIEEAFWGRKDNSVCAGDPENTNLSCSDPGIFCFLDNTTLQKKMKYIIAEYDRCRIFLAANTESESSFFPTRLNFDTHEVTIFRKQ